MNGESAELSISRYTEESVPLDSEGKFRESYLQRRSFVEAEFLKDKVTRHETIPMEEGAIVNVLSSFVEIPETITVEKDGQHVDIGLKKKDDEYNLTIYVPGLFQADKPNYGNHPLEVKLAGSLLTDKTDAVMLLKAEGLNNSAYEDEEGKGKVETTVSKAAFEVLQNKLKERGLLDQEGKPSQEIKFRIVGYSEGGTQGASIAARIAEHGIGDIQEYVSIGGAGLVGSAKQEEVDLKRFFTHAQSARKQAFIPGNVQSGKVIYAVEETPDTFFFAGKIIGDKKQGGLETSLGRAKVSIPSDLRNIGKWGLRLFESEIGIAEQVPLARLNAAATVNPDYDYLAERKIPIIVFSPTGDIFFPNSEVKRKAADLRETHPGSRVLLVSSNVGHDYPHNNPSGVAYAIELAKEKAHL